MVTDQLHDLAALFSEILRSEQEAWWTPEQVNTMWRKELNFQLSAFLV